MPGTNYLGLRYALASAMLMASFAIVSQAKAACDPATSAANPLINATVTCTGATVDQNGTTGYGVKQDKGNTINVQSGASVTGTNFGIEINNVSFANPETINNSGTISGASGIQGGFGTVNNFAGATISGSGGFGVEILGTGVVTNSGTISATIGNGVDVQNGTVTNLSGGTISGGISGVVIEDAGLPGFGNATVANAGTITGVTNGVRFRSTSGFPADLVNSGLISATDANGVGVSFGASGTVTNSGTIQAAAPVGIAIRAATDVTVNNSSTGTISGDRNGILASIAATVNNAGAISANGANGHGIEALAFHVVNSGRIDANGPNGVALLSGDAVNELTNTGVIAANGANGIGIASFGILNVNNSGNITAGGANGQAIFAVRATVTNSGFMGGEKIGIEGIASSDVTNTSAGTITAVGPNGIGILGDSSVKVDNAGQIAATDATGIAIKANSTADVINRGTGVISGGLNGIQATTTATVNNAGTIFGTTGNGILSGSANVINTSGGSISGDLNGIQATTAATVTNAGSIFGGASGNGIISGSANVINTSSGFISGGLNGIQATTTANVTNFGTISAGGGNGTAISSNGAAQVDNAGTIAATGFASTGIFGVATADVINRVTGIISGRSFGILAGSVNVTNAGVITGDLNAIQGDNVAVNNAGSIAGGANGTGIATDGIAAITNVSTGTISGGAFGVGAGVANVVNAGTITGIVGIQATDATRGSTITTSGTITGTGGTAIAFNAGAGNTLTLASGFVINGIVTNAAADITNTLQLGGSGNGTFDVSAIGTQYRNFGSFNKVDTSIFRLTGTSTFAGPVNVNGGTLAVNGNTASFGSLSVNARGTLGGNGVVGNTAINGGTLAPGNSIGLLTVQGNLVFTTAASYLVEVSATASDRTNVTGVATLGGATVNAVFAPGSNVVKQYTILNATGGVSGIFNPVVGSNNANIQSTLSYDANDVFLNLKLVFVAPNGLNTNQQNVANALSGFFNSTGSIPAVFATLGPGGLTQASGEAATGSQQTTFNAMNQFMGLLTDPFIAGRGDGMASSGGAPQFADANDSAADGKPHSTSERDAYAAIYRKAPVAESFAQRWSVWAAGYGGSQTTDGNAALGSNAATSRIYGTAVGADYRFSPFTLAGFALAGGGTNFSIANGLGGGRSDLFQAGAFVRHSVGPAYISAALAYGWQDVTTDRTVTIAGVDQLRAKFNANAWSGRVEGGYRFVTQGLGLTPYAAGQFTTFELPAYAETAVVGANTFALGYAAKSVTASRSEFGLRSDKSFAMQDAVLTLRGRAAWAHDFNADRNIAATFQTLPGASFVVNGAAQSPDAALATASAEMKWLNGFSLVATFEGEFSNVTRSYAGKGVARYAW